MLSLCSIATDREPTFEDRGGSTPHNRRDRINSRIVHNRPGSSSRPHRWGQIGRCRWSMGSHPVTGFRELPFVHQNRCRVGKGRPAGSIELRVSPSPSKIPYGGFSPVRLQMDRQQRPSTRSQRLKCRPHTPHDSILYATADATPRNT